MRKGKQNDKENGRRQVKQQQFGRIEEISHWPLNSAPMTARGRAGLTISMDDLCSAGQPTEQCGTALTLASVAEVWLMRQASQSRFPLLPASCENKCIARVGVRPFMVLRGLGNYPSL